MFRSSPLLARIGAFIVLPLVLALLGGYLYLRSALPEPGRTTLRAVDGSVTLSQDAHGVPRIEAASDTDVFFAMGYVHARDRGWQLELLRRSAQGRLSEVLGEAALGQDIWYRTLGLYRAGQASLAGLSAPARASLDAYAAGVNAWQASGAPAAPEMLVLGVRPAPWTPADSMAAMKLVALAMAGGMQAELERSAAAQFLTPAQLQMAYGPLALSPDAIASAAGSADLLAHLDASAPPSWRHVRAAGSNAWAVSGRHSATGRAMLANDPHMSLTMPSAWYVVQQSGPGIRSQGMTLVGMPLVIFGKNAAIAWGGTNMMADTQDLYIEQVRDATQSHYLDQGTWRPFRVREEAINVARPAPSWLHPATLPLKIRIRETVRGPVISDARPQMAQPVSLRWTALDPDDSSYEAFFRLNYASDWSQFRTALALQVAPALNMLYADQAGNIGFAGAGRLPVRAQGSGEVPRPGWTGQFKWTGRVAADAMPSLYNPASGVIVSANDKMAQVSYPDFVTLDWAPPYRAQRIAQLIAQRTAGGATLDAAAHQAMQQDLLALDALELRPALLQVQATDAQQEQALALLRSWDGHMRQDSAAAAMYAAWVSRLRAEIVTPKMNAWRDPRRNAASRAAVADNLSPQALARILADRGTTWCRRPGCPDELQAALSGAMADLSKLMERDPAGWEWGQVHHTYLRHVPFEESTFLGALFERRFSAPGGPHTVNAAVARLNGGRGYEQSFGAVFRQLMEPAGGVHYVINSSGQSGNPVSAQFADMTALYADGRYLQLSTAVKEVRP